MPHKEFPLEPSTLEIIDRALLEWVELRIDAHSSTNKGWKRTPVIWLSAERSHQIKKEQDLRDSSGTVILPVITVERASVTKDITRAAFGNLNVESNDTKGGSLFIKSRIKQDKTANFQNADAKYNYNQETFPNDHKAPVLFSRGGIPIRKKIVYETVSIPQPVFVEMGYRVGIRTEYQEQMNELISPFAIYTGNIQHFVINSDYHNYEAFFDPEISPQTNVTALQNDERRYETTMNIRVLGYLIGSDKNQKQPKIIVRETAAEIKFPRERVVFGDIPEHIDKDGFYRE
tara:strand:+ start:388 stop:1254 length:867 start_codon:yes stop_codon:yes gene_type:complete